MTIAPKILVADDDQALSRTLSWILKENGYEVLTVPGGEHLFDHLSAEQFDLLLLDIMMPKVDGLQLLQRVKADPRFKDLPVLMISSMPPEEATVRSLGLGASDFIPKPFRVRELLARVKAHLRAGRELNQARAEARSRSEMMEILQEVTASLKPEEIYQILVRRVAQGLNISRCSIIIAGPDDDHGTVVAAYENPMLHNLAVDLRRYPEIQHSLTTGEVVLVRDVLTDPLFQGMRAVWESEGAPARPLGDRDPVLAPAAARGVFFLRTTDGDTPLNEQDVQFAEQVINAAVAALEKAYDLESAVMGQEQMRHLAETDPLTNCFNRRALMEKLEQEMDRAARYATMLTGMMIDIDNFKQINDTSATWWATACSSSSPALLGGSSGRWTSWPATAARSSSCCCPRPPHRARNFAERILRRVAAHDFGGTGRPVRLTVSIGIATFPRRAGRPTANRSSRWRTPTSTAPSPTAATGSAIERPPLSPLRSTYPAAGALLRQGRLSAGGGVGAGERPTGRRTTRRDCRPAVRAGARRRSRRRPTSSPRSPAKCSTAVTGSCEGRRGRDVVRLSRARTSRPGACRDQGAAAAALAGPRGGAAPPRSELAMRLAHPNVCHILRLGETPERLVYLVMPFVEGEPLTEHERGAARSRRPKACRC